MTRDASMAYDYMFMGMPSSKTDKSRPMGGLDYKYDMNPAEVLQILNGCGVITSPKNGQKYGRGMDLGRYKKYANVITPEDIDFFLNGNGGGDIHEFIERLYSERTSPRQAPRRAPRQANAAPGPAPQNTNHVNTAPGQTVVNNGGFDGEVFEEVEFDGGDSGSYGGNSGVQRTSYTASGSGGWLKKALIAVLVVCLAFIGFRIFKSAPKTSAKIGTHEIGEMEKYSYDGNAYYGKNSRGKPDGVNFMWNSVTYGMGDYTKNGITGLGVMGDNNGTHASFGQFKKGKLNGAACAVSNGVAYAAEFKKGYPTGYGYKYDMGTGEESIVKFGKKGSISKVVATNSGFGWVKPNGKSFKLEEGGKYKGIEYASNGDVEINDVRFCFDDVAVSARYGTDVISWGRTMCTFDTITGSDNGLGIDMEYIYNVIMDGHYSIDDRSGMKFSVTFSRG